MFSPESARQTGLQHAVKVLCALLALAACPVLAQEHPDDPWEGVNRKLYTFNDTLDSVAIRPVAKGYQRLVPRILRTGVTNFFNNIDDVNVVLNDLLQLKIASAAHDSGRLILNSTVGIAGVIDVAAGVGLEKRYEDFGQTLGYWGMDAGPYLVLPFLGTSTVRDTLGMIPDAVFNPIFWVSDSKTRDVLYLTERVDTRVYYLLADELMQGQDEYAYVRQAMLERRQFLINDGVVRDLDDEFDF